MASESFTGNLASLVLCILGWGFSSFFEGVAGKHCRSIYSAILFTMLGSITGATLFAYVSSNPAFSTKSQQLGDQPDEQHVKMYAFAFAAGLCLSVGDFSYYRLMVYGKGTISSLASVTTLYFLIPCLLGMVVFNEPVTLRKLVAIVVLAPLMVLCLEDELGLGSMADTPQAQQEDIGV